MPARLCSKGRFRTLKIYRGWTRPGQHLEKRSADNLLGFHLCQSPTSRRRASTLGRPIGGKLFDLAAKNRDAVADPHQSHSGHCSSTRIRCRIVSRAAGRRVA